MKGEINRDYFCIADYFEGGLCSKPSNAGEPCGGEVCRHCHRKWPTHAQFKEEYGKECDLNLPMWWKDSGDIDKSWILDEYKRAMNVQTYNTITGRNTWMVVACTPWSKPPKDWRPE